MCPGLSHWHPAATNRFWLLMSVEMEWLRRVSFLYRTVVNDSRPSYDGLGGILACGAVILASLEETSTLASLDETGILARPKAHSRVLACGTEMLAPFGRSEGSSLHSRVFSALATTASCLRR